jgi:hypothetical protein
LPPPEKADEAVLSTPEKRIESLDPPSWPSSATVPPVVPGGSPSFPSEFEAPLAPTSSPRRAGRWLLVGAAAVVLIGAGVVGRRLHGSSAQAAAAPLPSAVAEAPAAPPPASEPAAAPAAAPNPAPQAEAPPAPVATMPARTPPAAAGPSRRSGGARPSKAAPHPALAKTQAKAAPAAAANKADSLDDMMRKAVNSK